MKEGGNGAVDRILMEEVQSPTLATRTKDTQQQYTSAEISSAKDLSDLHSPDLQRLAEKEERTMMSKEDVLNLLRKYHEDQKEEKNLLSKEDALLLLKKYHEGIMKEDVLNLLRKYHEDQKEEKNLLSKEDALLLLKKYHEDHYQKSQQPPPEQHPASSLPTCQALMSHPKSPFADGEILSRPTTLVNWVPRADGSRRLELGSVCTLKRYTQAEAKQCLAGHHLMWIGDSLTRYMWVSLTHFLHFGEYPPRFGLRDRTPRYGGPCPDHMTEDGKESCSPIGVPNVCKEGDFSGGWDNYYESLGDVNGIFKGHIDCHCSRDKIGNTPLGMDNMYYATPTNNDANINESKPKLVEMTFYSEIGWNDKPKELQNYRWRNCSLKGACQWNATNKVDITRRLKESDLDLNLHLEDALKSKILKKHTPADITLYNRGIWGEITKEKANRLMPLFHRFVTDHGRCFFRSTTPEGGVKHDEYKRSGGKERDTIRGPTLNAGCGYLDYAHLLQEFAHMPFAHPQPPKQKNGKVHSGFAEAANVFWDKVHFQPWVYEELNNFLLNVLCNADGKAAR